VVSARERSQLQNRRAALARLAELLLRGLERPAPRTATRPTRASKVARVVEKKKRGTVKARRRPPVDDE
jgi:ribosome-associated protein